MVMIAPQNDRSNEGLEDILVERNFCRGADSRICVMVANASNAAVRNNIMFGTDQTAGCFATTDEDGSTLDIRDVDFYNNTCFDPTGTEWNAGNFADVDAPAAQLFGFNNLFIQSEGLHGSVATYWRDNVVTTSEPWDPIDASTPDDYSPRNFVPNVGSSVDGAGVPPSSDASDVAITWDLFGVWIQSNPPIGAAQVQPRPR
jgi:hypothetical protein